MTCAGKRKLKDNEHWLKLILGLVEEHIKENFLVLFCPCLTKQAKEEKKEICVHEPSPN